MTEIVLYCVIRACDRTNTTPPRFVNPVSAITVEIYYRLDFAKKYSQT